MITIDAPKDLRGLLRSGGDQRKLARGAYCAKPGGCKCKTHANLALPKLNPTDAFRLQRPEEGPHGDLQRPLAEGLLQEPKAGTRRRRVRRILPGAADAQARSARLPAAPRVRARTGSGSCTPRQGSPQYTQVAPLQDRRLHRRRELHRDRHRRRLPPRDRDQRLLRDSARSIQSQPGARTRPLCSWAAEGRSATSSRRRSPPVGNGAGGISFASGGRQFGFAFGPTWSAAGGAGGNMTVAGGATCIYPAD